MYMHYAVATKQSLEQGRVAKQLFKDLYKNSKLWETDYTLAAITQIDGDKSVEEANSKISLVDVNKYDLIFINPYIFLDPDESIMTIASKVKEISDKLLNLGYIKIFWNKDIGKSFGTEIFLYKTDKSMEFITNNQNLFARFELPPEPEEE